MLCILFYAKDEKILCGFACCGRVCYVFHTNKTSNKKVQIFVENSGYKFNVIFSTLNYRINNDSFCRYQHFPVNLTWLSILPRFSVPKKTSKFQHYLNQNIRYLFHIVFITFIVQSKLFLLFQNWSLPAWR